jgi:phosphoribosylglycinamide formyltransferase-1
VSVRLGVLVSGSGTNLQAVLDAAREGRLGAQVAVVVSNRAAAKALDRARDAGVEAVCLGHKEFASREAYDAALVALLRERGVDLVVLAGFMRIVTPVLLEAFPDRVVNIHPSLLPAFPGLDAQAQAFAAGVAVSGCTVHLVDGGMDTGPILAQAAVPVHATDDVEALRLRILAEEHRLLPEVLQWFVEGRVSLDRCAGAAPRVRIEGRPRARFGAP